MDYNLKFYFFVDVIINSIIKNFICQYIFLSNLIKKLYKRFRIHKKEDHSLLMHLKIDMRCIIHNIFTKNSKNGKI